MSEQLRKEWLAQISNRPLPEVVKTKHGTLFYPRRNHWKFGVGTKKVSCNFELMPEVTPLFLDGFKRAMIDAAKKMAGSSIQNTFSGMLTFLRFVADQNPEPISELSYEDVEQCARSSTRAESYMARNRSFIQAWAKCHYPGISPDLAQRYPKCKPHPVGVAVATADPRKGTYDDQEFEALLEGLNAALERGDIELDRALETRIIALIGIRPDQVAQLKCCDVDKGNSGRVVLRVPMIKKGNQGVRDEFRNFPLEPTTGEVLFEYSQEVKRVFAALLSDPGEAPLFPDEGRGISSKTYTPGLLYHPSTRAMTKRIADTLEKTTAFSARLGGERIPGTPVRFRRSFAQRGADEGLDIYTLAWLMGHADVNNVKVYFEITDRVRAAFSKKISLEMAPLVKAFGSQLHILRDEAEATRSTPISRIPDLRLDEHGNLKVLASCASCTQCNLLRPIACYSGCSSFEPWLDADHEAVLDRMLADREERGEIDERIAKIRDRAILGCAQIILRCREILAQEASWPPH